MKKKHILILAGIVILYIAASSVAEFYFDYRWFGIYGGEVIFWRLLTTKFYVHTFFSLAFIALFFLNFLLIRLLGGSGRIFTAKILDRLKMPIFGTPRRALFILLAAGVVLIGFVMGGAAASFWKEILQYLYSVPFRGFPADPIFGIDPGFYVFSLPVYNFLYGWLFSAFIIILAFSALFHIMNRGIYVTDGRLEFSLFARAHISTLLAAIVVLYGIGYRLSAYELLFSQMGKFFGAGYTAVHANLVSYTVAMVLSFAAAALFLFNIFKRSFRLPLLVLAALIPAYFILGVIYPAIQQKFIVEPNELGKERPYIEHNIRFTRIAYGLQNVREIDFANKDTLTYADILKNRIVIENVRLWDWRPLKQTYKQLQEQKPYYFFNDVDVDRYVIDGKKFAVNLAARELSIDELPKNSQSWQNRHLIFTHGYGLVMSRVDRITPEGQPDMIIRDIPPRTTASLPVDRPEIYYGEHRNDYVIANTSIEPGEFDYPYGDENKYARYQGKGGIPIDSLFTRILAAVYFKDKNMIFMGSITPSSRLLYRRNIVDMVNTFTPFLEFDDDPYLVLSEGRLYWIIDAYTTTGQFPYSSPIEVGRRRINYIRNSVKVVIDAYDGTMTYYITDRSDPLIRTYDRIFPGVFRDITAMPPDLLAHLRYPETIFNIQSRMLLKYHMTDPTIFYNNEDAWAIPMQISENQEEPVHSYYLVTRLPKEQRDEFILILPFTPYRRNNMVSFFVAKCDQPSYGELSLYRLPKDKLSYGPMQVEARIDQDPEISSQLTLWNQKGSSVLRGNMLAIPIEESILYIEPLYLKAASSEMPELRRVIVAFGDRIVMEKDLSSSLERLFGKGGIAQQATAPGMTQEMRLRDLASKAYNSYQRAEQSVRQGDWAKFGEEMKQLRDLLRIMGSGQ
ncbi:MAG: UPF0182 family protein [Spirochaetes bacterium]|nr:UPF0182 family protein [Spirochaetota bacterium]